MVNKYLIFTSVIVLILVSAQLAEALTGSIGNSRMVLRMDYGDTVEKSILVKNVNDVPITIEVFPGGDLGEYIKLRDEKFELSPGAEKKAYFTITAKKKGTTESKINVKFTPKEGNGVGLSSTVIVITSDGESLDEEDENLVIEGDSKKGFSFNPSGNSVSNLDQKTESSFSPAKILLISSGVLVLLFIALIFYYTKINKGEKKKVGRQSEK